MSSIPRAIEFLSPGTWVGGIILLNFGVAPGAFATLGSHDLAGAVVGMALGRLHILGLIAGLMYLASRVALARSLAALASPVAMVVILMIVLTLGSQYWLSPRRRCRAPCVPLDAFRKFRCLPDRAGGPILAFQ